MTPYERPILFSNEMVHAILEGRKTQTRRVITARWQQCLSPEDEPDTFVGWCPYGLPGDTLWVRETFCVVDDRDYGGELWVDYRATPRYAASHPAGWDNAPEDAEALKWKPSIHMPRKYSRITLEVTGVRVEQVQAISLDDVLAEGIEPEMSDSQYWRENTLLKFAELWDSINGRRGYSWELNPYVWCVSFRVVSP